MLSIDRFRKLVDPGGQLDESELRELRQEIHNLAEVLVEIASDRLHACLHRRNPVTESNRFRSVIPRETDHRFRFNPVTLTGSSEWVTGMNRNRASKGV